MLNAGSRLRLLVSESAGSGFGSRIFVPGFALAWTAEAAVATWLRRVPLGLPPQMFYFQFRRQDPRLQLGLAEV
jgi:hypothetical protein